MRLLQELGYTDVREYAGGMADWLDHGGGTESAARRRRVRTGDPGRARRVSPRPVARRRAWRGAAGSLGDRLVDALVLDRSIGGLLGIWLAVIVGFGAIYWAAGAAGRPWIDGAADPGSLAALINAIYFSFVTALTIGYGDISPLGPARALAVIEGAAGLLIFGLVISKLVSRRQEELLEDTHRIAFEQRLGRVRTSLHLVLSELQGIEKMCSEHAVTADRVRIRAESTLAVFEGELRTVHDLLYRPEQTPDEQALEAILASISASLEVLHELVECMPEASRSSPMFRAELRQIHLRAIEICADCVPREYTADLAEWMDRVQGLAEGLG